MADQIKFSGLFKMPAYIFSDGYDILDEINFFHT